VSRAVSAAPARRCRILATIGPSSRSPEVLRALLEAGADAIRLNMSHGRQEDHAAAIALARGLARELQRPLAILMDLQGPKIRTGTLAGGYAVPLHNGAKLTITTRVVEGTATCVSTTYADLPNDVKSGDTILVDDGLLELRVDSVAQQDVICTVVHGGLLKEHKGINLPGVAVSAPAVTEKDLSDLEFGIAQGVDYVALSFVRKPEDIVEVRQRIEAASAPIQVIAKLEKPEALDCLDAILQISDGVMIARGDLGVEIALERVPVLQKEIIRKANLAGILVITATQMLESMITNPRPTRAEASDVANAVLDGTDVVMLSGETAAGQFPVQTVQTMARIVTTAEGVCVPLQPVDHFRSHAHALARAAATLVANTAVCALVVFTQSGLSAKLVSKERPDVPILAFTDNETVYEQLALWWGVTPFLCEFAPTTEDQIATLQDALVASGHASPGDTVVIMGSLPVMRRARTNFLKLHRIE
jgi:pyruvate kinase